MSRYTHDGQRENKRLWIKRRGFKRAIYTWNKTEDATSFCRDFPVQHITTEEAPRFLWLYMHSTVIERERGRALGSRSGFTHSTLLMLLLRHRHRPTLDERNSTISENELSRPAAAAGVSALSSFLKRAELRPRITDEAPKAMSRECHRRCRRR